MFENWTLKNNDAIIETKLMEDRVVMENGYQLDRDLKVYEVKDETDESGKALAWLFYSPETKQFRIELSLDADYWTTPLLLSSMLERGEYSINSYWSQMWVEQRIVPIDRQNIQQILEDNGLKAYDPYELLILANGRCAQDDYYLKEVQIADLPEEIMSQLEQSSDGCL